MCGRRDNTFYALSSTDGINPPRHFVLHWPPGPRAASAVAQPQGKPSDLKGGICALPTWEGKWGSDSLLQQDSRIPGPEGSE